MSAGRIAEMLRDLADEVEEIEDERYAPTQRIWTGHRPPRIGDGYAKEGDLWFQPKKPWWKRLFR